jgi:hypothetical protein
MTTPADKPALPASAEEIAAKLSHEFRCHIDEPFECEDHVACLAEQIARAMHEWAAKVLENDLLKDRLAGKGLSTTSNNLRHLCGSCGLTDDEWRDAENQNKGWHEARRRVSELLAREREAAR